MSKKSKIILWSCVAVVILSVAFVWHLRMWRIFVLTYPHKTTDETPVHVVLREQEYWIPRNYFTFPYTEMNRKEQTLGIRAYYPDMNGATKETIEYEKTNFGHANKIRILINGNLGSTPALSYAKSFAKKINRKDEYSNYAFKGDYHGLYYYMASPAISSGNFEDIYVEDDKDPKILIYCTGALVKRTPSPGCRMNIRRDAMDYRISFSREHLPEWRSIQHKVYNLLEKFSIKPSNLSITGESK